MSLTPLEEYSGKDVYKKPMQLPKVILRNVKVARDSFHSFFKRFVILSVLIYFYYLQSKLSNIKTVHKSTE